MNERILITGTGRCGTTFLLKLFSFLQYDTGYSKENYKNNIHDNCNSGMERHYKENFYILKNPNFIVNINHIIHDKDITIKNVIIPIREYNDAALSRLRHGKNPGGLWRANGLEVQILFYRRIISDYIYFMTRYNINTTFIDFDEMISNKKYLFDKLKPILDEKNIKFEFFLTYMMKLQRLQKQ